MQGGRSRRPLAIGLALAAIAAGVVLALVLSRDDDGKESAASAPARTTETTETQTAAPTETGSETRRAQRRDQEEIEQTVIVFVESAEQVDSRRACSQVAGGAGKQLEDCAAAAGIDLRKLPSSDELQIDEVKVSGDRATAKLSNGTSFTLVRTGGKWKLARA